eukprot:gene6143-10067_t
MPLGAPAGPAAVRRNGSVVAYERRFASGTRATLTVAPAAAGAGTGCVYWAGGHVTGGA